MDTFVYRHLRLYNKAVFIGLKLVCELFNYKYNTLANMLNGHRKNNSIFEYK